MKVLCGLQPEGLFRFFEEITRIPRGSGNIQMISDYLVSFAQKRNLSYKRDEYRNVIIWKPGSKGYEDSAPVILQAHMDMVAVKEPGLDKDMEKEGVDLLLEGDMITAKGTSLGGDNGIGMAYILAVLDDDKLAHPPIEGVFTVDEEVGLVGASHMDASCLQGRTMINLDSEDEGIMCVSCAGGMRVHPAFDREEEEASGLAMHLLVDGFPGGHSGMEIDKDILNSNLVMARLLYELSMVCDFHLISINGGIRDNAIPSLTEAEIVLVGKEGEDRADFAESGCGDAAAGKAAEECLQRVFEEIRAESGQVNSDIRLQTQVTGPWTGKAFTKELTRKVIITAMTLPNGIQKRDPDQPDKIRTSLNLGVIKTGQKQVTLTYGIRSSVESEINELKNRLTGLTQLLGGSVTYDGAYSAWPFNEESRIRRIMEKTYRDMYGKDMVEDKIHAGVECGCFAGKMPGLDAVSIGPDLYNVHSTRERLSVSSSQRTWDFLSATLRNLK